MSEAVAPRWIGHALLNRLRGGHDRHRVEPHPGRASASSHRGVAQRPRDTASGRRQVQGHAVILRFSEASPGVAQGARAAGLMLGRTVSDGTVAERQAADGHLAPAGWSAS